MFLVVADCWIVTFVDCFCYLRHGPIIDVLKGNLTPPCDVLMSSPLTSVACLHIYAALTPNCASVSTDLTVRLQTRN